MIYQCGTIGRSIIRIQFKCSIIHKINSTSTSINFQKVTINRTGIIVRTPGRTICYLNTSVANNTSSLHHSYIRSLSEYQTPIFSDLYLSTILNYNFCDIRKLITIFYNPCASLRNNYFHSLGSATASSGS